jgi:hypothetical protein
VAAAPPPPLKEKAAAKEPAGWQRQVLMSRACHPPHLLALDLAPGLRCRLLRTGLDLAAWFLVLGWFANPATYAVTALLAPKSAPKGHFASLISLI